MNVPNGETELPYEVHVVRSEHEDFINYSYLLIDRASSEAVIVDPSWDAESFTHLLQRYRASLKMILLTHAHEDHVNVDDLVRRYHAQVYMSNAEIAYYHFNCPNLNGVNDNDTLWLGQLQIHCLLTPGHSQGGMCFYLEGALFTGDTIFIEGCGGCDFEGGSAPDMFDSIQLIRKLIPADTLIYPGHSFGKPVGQPMKSLFSQNIYFMFRTKETFVNFRTRSNQPPVSFK